MRRNVRLRAGLVLLTILALFGAACGDDDDGAAPTTTVAPTTTEAAGEPDATPEEPEETTTTTEAPAAETLRILVTNDDGVGSEGIDAIVEALRALPDTEVVVVAPAENQSGKGDSTTGGELVGTETTTASGYPVIAVEGTPADSIIWAFEQGGIEELPDLVVSGINEGQNIGPFSSISGTVGAARTVARFGVPAIAVSQGVVRLADGSTLVDYEAGVEAALEALAAVRDDILAGTYSVEPVTVWNINVPSCPTGEVRGLAEAPIATDFGDRNALEVDCESTLEGPVDDVDAFTNGFASLTVQDIVSLDELLASIVGG